MAKQKINQSQQPNISRQNNTTNTSISGSKIETGWGVITNNTSGNAITESVSFSSVFTDRPIVLIICGGDNATLQTYGSGGINLAAGIVAQATDITTSSFLAMMAKRDSTNFAPGYTFYQWIAIGI